jgi:hypothetical protein
MMAGAFSIEPRHFNRSPFIVLESGAMEELPLSGLMPDDPQNRSQNQQDAEYCAPGLSATEFDGKLRPMCMPATSPMAKQDMLLTKPT